MKPTYVVANDAERARLNALLDRLTDEDLARRLPNGLTVSAVLIHLAFWDQYAASVLRQWQQSGFSASATNFEALNSSIIVMASAVPARAAVEMLRTAAAVVDHEAQSVPAELASVVVENGKVRTLERAQHRREHLDQLDEVLPAP